MAMGTCTGKGGEVRKGKEVLIAKGKNFGTSRYGKRSYGKVLKIHREMWSIDLGGSRRKSTSADGEEKTLLIPIGGGKLPRWWGGGMKKVTGGEKEVGKGGSKIKQARRRG